ncbi:hypothetical protein AB0C34_23460 [Nocardia sp. NPDC049220]|uniref:hypothetical protein n=1 Tax=Nocardia sp. NPDC049220 TaxID=3155273 RepID=UPI0033BFEA74
MTVGVRADVAGARAVVAEAPEGLCSSLAVPRSFEPVVAGLEVVIRRQGAVTDLVDRIVGSHAESISPTCVETMI